MSKFIIEEKAPEPEKKPSKSKTPKSPTSPKKKETQGTPPTPAEVQSQIEIYGEPSQEIKKRLIKMFRAACNGKNYYKKWFPELKDTGDFEAAFIQDLNKLK